MADRVRGRPAQRHRVRYLKASRKFEQSLNRRVQVSRFQFWKEGIARYTESARAMAATSYRRKDITGVAISFVRRVSRKTHEDFRHENKAGGI